MKQEKLPTRLRILTEALNLFSVSGYEAVTVAEIADAVGIKAPSLYKHYKSKQDIFDAIIGQVNARYAQMAASMQVNGLDAEKDKNLFMSMDEHALIEIGKSLFDYFLHDDYTRKFRKMLTIEQYRNPELASSYVLRYMDNPLTYQGQLFSSLIKAGLMIKEDTSVMALHFYAPVFLLLNLCDCNPEREPEAIRMVEQHILQFYNLYRKKEDS